MRLDMKKPCANCPFLKIGAIDLQPGRLEGIIADLTASDQENFMCHKTVHGPKGGAWDDDENKYVPSGNESMCIGSAVYMWKAGNPSVALRMAFSFKLIKLDDVRKLARRIIDPPEQPED